MKKSNLSKRLIVLITSLILVASMLFSGFGTFTYADTEKGELIPQEESVEIVTIEIPNAEAAELLSELEIDFDHGIHEHDGVWETEVIVTPTEIEQLKKHGIKVKETVMTEQVWEKRINEINKAVKKNEKAVAQTEKLQILRANHYTNQSATFLYIEAKSNAGAAASTALTATWTVNGEEKTASLSRKVDYGEYLYHYLELPVEAVPATIKVTSNQGSEATSDVTEWLGGDRPDPGEHYVKEFVDHYMNPVEINEKMDQLAEEFPDLVEIIDMPNKTNGYRRHSQATIGNFTNSAVSITSKSWGHEGGNDIKVDFINLGTENAPLEVIIEDEQINVKLATDGSGNITSTSKQVVTALNQEASDLVSATTYRGNSGDGIAEVKSVSLTDGLKASEDVSRDPETVRAFRIGKDRDGTKPGVLGYSQEHAREWVTPLVTMETAERLLRNYAHDEETRKLVDNLDIFLVPSVNPDGAKYSFFDYNMQRRNMTNYCAPEQASDFAARNSWGVDLNRNHAIGSVYDGFIGGSTSCTSDTYAGPEKNSEPEANNIVWLADNFPNIDFAMNIHSHGGYFMWSPGAYDRNRTPLPRPTAGEEAFYWGASEHILAKIQDHRGTVILPARTGPIPDVLYSAGGNSADYLWYEKGIYAWNFEVGAPLWQGNRWVSVGFQPAYEEGHEEAMEFSNGLIGLLEVALQQAEDDINPESVAVPGSGRYQESVEVAIETSEPATVYYTLDGSNPTFESDKIQLKGTREDAEVLTIDKTTTVKYFSVDPAGNVENDYDPSKGKGYNSATFTIGGDENKAPGVSDLEALVDRLNQEGEISNPVLRSLKLHLTAIAQFEKQENLEKIAKHLQSFIVLVDQQKNKGMITEKAANSLKAYTEYLIERWDIAFDSEKVMDHVEHLSVGIGPRVTGTAEEKEAAEFIKTEFKRLGYEVSTQEFDIRNGLKSQNVVAVKKPKGIENPEIVYVTGHYDSVRTSPGANDNGTGTGSILELARILKDVPVNKEVRFVAFGAEEQGLSGSRYYVNQLSDDEIARSAANYNLDMVGTNYDPASQLHVTTVDGQANEVWESIEAAADQLNIDEENYTLHQLGRSDHVPFHEAGIDAALFIWMEPGTPPGAVRIEPWYHSSQDTIERVSPERIQMVGDLIQSAVQELITQSSENSMKQTTDKAA
ncbi:M28 family peptidase [Cytobacillus purgationiresistens]|uniref:Peptidase M14 domain-containing protein n=1 Tax=Cytobacillus purgationiresistens TaxID=863449 RepID=A0ABU0AR63_9BACI|nr:M28 family peptidase [Cytobacillus purgationiresistens]MDQ0273777.1 hypothetical protein [Cytobacillus purgationiresistens]